ncbi:helix-turn-helix domain-containing protein [Erythrobacter sp. THAF29]|uniref:helix-turn-helix domain-containing protein n=1 Tax=Erythrobacter sp. THAF29 TaxID=2587851 RepID=UPI0012685598|nr:helix-turn-helix domain-containing protein [Erythrobacter sp. THAF29]QFT76008.1 hypothetical protein FIU90_00495 [Erythrobacter sp. THAF29]
MSNADQVDLRIALHVSEDCTSGPISVPKPVQISSLAISLDERQSTELRRRLLPKEWRGNIPWDILIELYVNELSRRPTTVKQVGLAADAPCATVHRHLANLVDRGWIVRDQNHRDQRVVNLSLTTDAFKLIEGWSDSRIKQLKSLIDRY